MTKRLRIDQLGIEQLPRTELEKMHNWLERGDSIAVYENADMGHYELGHRRFVSFGSEQAQFQGDPPEQLPDFPREINWRYRLVGVFLAEDLGTFLMDPELSR